MCEFCYMPQLSGYKPRYVSHAMGYRDKYWPNGSKIKVSVLGNSKSDIDYIMSSYEVWADHANLSFMYIEDWGSADIRVQTADGVSYSYVGIDALGLNKGRPTMNLGWIDQDILRNDLSTGMHECGHSIGLGHEHQNPNNPFDWNEANVIKDLGGPPNNWDEATIRHNVLRRVPVDEVDSTVLDPDSIMMYFFPDHWLNKGKGTRRNKELSDLDKQFISLIYPKGKALSLKDFLKELLHNDRSFRRLDKSQLMTCLQRLEVPFIPLERKKDLRNKLKNAL